MAKNRHHTQWAGTFAAAAVLSKLDFCVSITLGNTPACDLLCISPHRKPFKVEVKSTNSKNFIRIQKSLLELEEDAELFLIVVLLGKDTTTTDHFYILRHREVRDAWAKVPKIKRSGEPLIQGHEGLNWTMISEHENQWDKLPP